MPVAGDDDALEGRPRQAFSRADAIAADALPAPTTIVRPATGCGRCKPIAQSFDLTGRVGSGESGVKQRAQALADSC